jgi:hypothetical protein
MRKVICRPLTLVSVVAIILLASCTDVDDPGPLQEDERNYTITNFDRLEMGSAFIIKVRQGEFFDINVRGDRRNIDDLEVFKEGSTLVVRFDDNGGRHHETYVNISMPLLEAVNFSGATNSTVTGFELDDSFRIQLSGASVCQVSGEFKNTNLLLSGASNLTMTGYGNSLNAEVSGASYLQAFHYSVEEADVEVSGSSRAKISVNKDLKAEASGSSIVYYRGEPSVKMNTSGSSSVVKD